jgi:hypothetical protein
MVFRIENHLRVSDLRNLAHALEAGVVDSIELLPGVKYAAIEVAPLVISARDGFSLNASLYLQEPIGNTVCSTLRLEEDGLKKSPRTIEIHIHRPKYDPEELAISLQHLVSLIEKVVNYTCAIRNEKVYDVFILDAAPISHQLEAARRKEREERGDKIAAFELVHADSGSELKWLSASLVPLYEEYDRWDLYGGKKVYRLLPRNFVAKLLKCQKDTLIPEDEFSDREKEVLNYLAKRRQIRRRKIAGRTCYFDLEDKTRTYLIKALNERKL